MSSCKQACFHFPTTVLLVDDNQTFLKSMDKHLGSELSLLSFDKSKDALAHVKNTSAPLDEFLTGVIGTLESDDTGSRAIEIELRNLQKQIYNPNRFSEMGVAIIDYSMPEMDGEELSKKLKAQNHLLKILMLTGEANQKTAVKFFNEKIIDNFIRKDDSDVVSEIHNHVDKLSNDLFLDITEKMFFGVNDIPSFLKEKDSYSIVNAFSEKVNAVEYYLLDEYGSFLFLDADANPTWLVVCTEGGMSDYEEIASSQDAAPKDIVATLTKREKVPFFFTDSERSTPPEDWAQFMHPASKLEGEFGIYYIAEVTDPNAHEFDKSKVVSLNQHVKAK